MSESEKNNVSFSAEELQSIKKQIVDELLPHLEKVKGEDLSMAEAVSFRRIVDHLVEEYKGHGEGVKHAKYDALMMFYQDVVGIPIGAIDAGGMSLVPSETRALWKKYERESEIPKMEEEEKE